MSCRGSRQGQSAAPDPPPRLFPPGRRGASDVCGGVVGAVAVSPEGGSLDGRYAWQCGCLPDRTAQRRRVWHGGSQRSDPPLTGAHCSTRYVHTWVCHATLHSGGPRGTSVGETHPSQKPATTRPHSKAATTGIAGHLTTQTGRASQQQVCMLGP